MECCTHGVELASLPWVLFFFNSFLLPPPQGGQRGLSKMQPGPNNLKVSPVPANTIGTSTSPGGAV